MSLPVKTQIQYWGAASLAFLLLMWFLGDIILPFILGGAIAYFLDPVADRLEAMGCSRVLSVCIITLLAILLFAVLVMLIFPTLIEQTLNLFNAAPEIFSGVMLFLGERFPDLVNESSILRKSLAAAGDVIQDKGTRFLDTALSTAASIFNVIVIAMIVPIVAFYLLLDWDRMTAKVKSLLPRDHKDVIIYLLEEIDGTLSSFIRGMGTVCLILGSFYAVALMLVGLQYGLVIGAFAGLITFIPYLGALLGGVLAIGLALFQFWGDWLSIGLVAGIFIAGQILEGNVLTPKLVGGKVGLHPVWVIVALSVFGSLFGFVGMLVAVPVAAVIGVLARFAVQHYEKSLLFHGESGKDAE
ncbi:MAG: AI-2E family transporter [Roseovarius sp.]|nr:AI-2E family transporter [Roseovarius sp.]MCY4209300.1 AI-2E family transporter [Roseovarius sp.]MCY4292147.1 AI-2E family transporter [Roseovarius sp.]MCY4316624.1 AI-2E family transporter [Roseovarius sp.]